MEKLKDDTDFNPVDVVDAFDEEVDVARVFTRNVSDDDALKFGRHGVVAVDGGIVVAAKGQATPLAQHALMEGRNLFIKSVNICGREANTD